MVVDLAKTSLRRGLPQRRPSSAASFGEAGFPKLNHRKLLKLLGFPKGPGTQGPKTQKLLHSNDPGVAGAYNPPTISEIDI